MGKTNRNRVIQDGAVAAADGAWDIDRATLWTWLAAALENLDVATMDAQALHIVCAQVLDTHAPAALVHAQADGILIEHLVYAAVVETYSDLYGQPDGPYDVTLLRAAVHRLRYG